MKTLLAIFALAFLTACGTAKAGSPPPQGCDINGACFQHQDFAWGYCHYGTNQSGKTFSGSLEIGINTNIADANQSICNIELAFGGEISAISGNVSYKSFNRQNPASMAVNLRACASESCVYPNEQEQLMSLKFGVEPNQQFSLPYAMRFDSPVKARRLMLVFNDDLQQAKPTSISVAFFGTLK